ncbi:MAG: hypothetical protein AAFX06_23220 [Planctomycetota bacterium]
MRSFVCVLTLVAGLAFANSSSADVLVFGEQQQLASTVVAPGQYTLDLFIEGVGATENVQGFNFELDFNDPNLSFVSYNDVLNPQLPFVGAGSAPGLTGIGSSNLFGGPVVIATAGVPVLIGSVTFDVLGPTSLAEIPFGPAFDFRDPSNEVIAASFGSPASIEAAPVPSPTGFAAVLSLGAIATVVRRRRNA